MLERRSALAAATPYRSALLSIGESADFSLNQVSGFGKAFEKSLTAAVGKLPKQVGHAAELNDRTVMRIGPDQFWVVGARNDTLADSLAPEVLVTPLSSSRTRIFIEGTPARDVLAKGIPLDFHAGAFRSGHFAMTGLHHTPVVVHCVSENRFEIYAMRTFALSVWDCLTDAALEFT